MSNPSDELSGPALRLLDAVESVTIVKGHIPSDPVTWHIKISGHTIEIDSEKMDTSTQFKKQYLKVFYRPPPAIKNSDWLPFVEAMSENAEVVTAKEATEHVYMAQRLMESIRALPIVSDDVDVLQGRGFYVYKGFYCLISKKIEQIIESSGWKTHAQTLSPVVAALGYKVEGNERIYVGGDQKRFWWFYPDAIIEPVESATSAENEISPEVMECQ